MAGVYFHIPYCKQACSYCDFHFSTSKKSMKEMALALSRELDFRKDFFSATSPLKSVYFGGGTPSLFPPSFLGEILEGLLRHFSLEMGAEVTLEANPDDLSSENLAAWKSLGINRLSIGIQSMDEATLRVLKRAHTSQQALQAVARAQDAGFDQLTIDLIYGLPTQDLEGWKRTLDWALSLNVPHFSAYALTLENKTLLHHQVKKGWIHFPEDEVFEDQFRWLYERAQEQGYQAYEISNFCLPGKEAVHNTNYWLGASYLGIGPSAHGFDGDTRYWNVSNNPEYLRKMGSFLTPTADSETLTLCDRINETLMTRLRLQAGLDTRWFQEIYGLDIFSVRREQIQKEVEAGFLVRKEDSLVLTMAGKLQSNRLLSELFFTNNEVPSRI